MSCGGGGGGGDGGMGRGITPISSPIPLPHELTAEWTVRAQLTFARNGEPVQKEYGEQDALHPVRVVYKLSAPSTEQDADKVSPSAGQSFRSTTTDSAFGSPHVSHAAAATAAAPSPQLGASTTAQICGTQCRSTCNIMVSAIADFLPQQEVGENEPFIYHSKVKAQQLRDAFSQTSDTEERQQQQQQQLTSSKRRPTAYDQRRATTDALMRSFNTKRHAEEANTFRPTYSPTPTPSSTFKSASMPRIPQLNEKKPRTVHIDVYCTGSEEEQDEEEVDQADAEVSSTSSSGAGNDNFKPYDLDSNSTPQTVLDNEQMLLRHQRISSTQAMPRRWATNNNNQQQQHNQTKQQPKQQAKQTTENDHQEHLLNLGHAITKSSTAEEVSESKQLLFRKHIGDQRAAKLANLRQKYMRQPSAEDTLSSSSAYPNSSRSSIPARDATCSSISSAAALAGSDCVDSSWKETDEVDTPIFNLTKSDSFDYDNSLDRLRIRQMERLWSRPNVEQPVAPVGLQTIRENQFQRSDTIPSESDGFSDTNNIYNTYPKRQQQQPQRPGFLQFFGPMPQQHLLHQREIPQTAPVQPIVDPFRLLHPSYRWKSEARDNLSVQVAPDQTNSPSSERSSPQLLSAATTVVRCGSEAPPSTTSASTLGMPPPPSPIPIRRFDITRADSPSVVSEATTLTATVLSGYTHEHLEKARRFGNVVTMRKPGHHVGPTKNPNCHCESCQRWLAERFQLRGRAFSLGERPLLRRPQI
ncbi:uncharacterized protein Dwil_GK27624 [Drosophila willistoni]|uniref:Uncharacterized protein n=1 Tax=Drosophila willistoni TaxID=7260 RepID=A0A0Q9X4C9_DROWI|nr:uncharacterized protein Dwil_GK27624 [Drosophila willistoni]